MCDFTNELRRHSSVDISENLFNSNNKNISKIVERIVRIQGVEDSSEGFETGRRT
jgi:hypothetical protein